jgi:hypothetical protein
LGILWGLRWKCGLADSAVYRRQNGDGAGRVLEHMSVAQKGEIAMVV